MSQPTIDDVAAAAGVSAATVSRALRGLDKVHPDTRERVRKAARDLNYIASPTASGLASGRTRLVGAITPFMGRWFFTNVISAIDKAMRDHHHHLLLMDLEEKSPDQRLSLTQSMMFKRVDGLIVINVELNDGGNGPGEPVAPACGDRGYPVRRRSMGWDRRRPVRAAGRRAPHRVGPYPDCLHRRGPPSERPSQDSGRPAGRFPPGGA